MFLSNIYYLYNKDKPIAKFKCLRDGFNDPHFSLLEQYDSFLPFGFNKNDVDSFIKSRRAPSNREHIQEILTRCGCNDLEGFIRFSYCASLNDTFWIKPENRDITWNEVSLYRNKFNENIARIAFDGGLMGEVISTATPEVGTDGSFAKCWKRIGSDIFLLKRNGIAEREVFSERYAYELASQLCEHVVPYELMMYRKKLATRCQLFTSESVSFTPMARILGNGTNFMQCMDYFDKIGSLDYFREMIVLDALTLNTDRHLKNFGVLYDSDNGTIKSMAPIFDNNYSLLPFANTKDLEDYVNYLPTRPCAFEDDFNRLAIRCLSAELKRKLKDLKDFHFQESVFFNEKFDDVRLKLLERVVHYQIRNLLQERMLFIPKEVSPDQIHLNLISFEVKSSEFAKEDFDLLQKGEFTIPDFNITFENGTIGCVSNVKASFFCNNDTLYFETYDCNLFVSKTPSSLKIKEVNGFQINLNGNVEEKSIRINPLTFEISNEKNSFVTELSLSIPFTCIKKQKDSDDWTGLGK